MPGSTKVVGGVLSGVGPEDGWNLEAIEAEATLARLLNGAVVWANLFIQPDTAGNREGALAGHGAGNAMGRACLFA